MKHVYFLDANKLKLSKAWNPILKIDKSALGRKIQYLTQD